MVRKGSGVRVPRWASALQSQITSLGGSRRRALGNIWGTCLCRACACTGDRELGADTIVGVNLGKQACVVLQACLR